MPPLVTFLDGAVLKLFIASAIGFVVGVVMIVVYGVHMVQGMTDEAQARYLGGRGFPLFLPDDAFFDGEGRRCRDRMQAWLAGALLTCLAGLMLILIHVYVLHCAGFGTCGRTP